MSNLLLPSHHPSESFWLCLRPEGGVSLTLISSTKDSVPGFQVRTGRTSPIWVDSRIGYRKKKSEYGAYGAEGTRGSGAGQWEGGFRKRGADAAV